MKPRLYIFQKAVAAMTLLLLAGGMSHLPADPLDQSAATEIPKSAFVMPGGPSEGCDPFFPDSTRPYNYAKAIARSTQPATTFLQIKSIMGASPRYFAIIGTKDFSGGAHTFGIGEDGDVITKDGHRISIHVTKITPTSVEVEADGQIVDLSFLSE